MTLTLPYVLVADLFLKYLYVWTSGETSSSDDEAEKRRLLDEETDEELEERYANISVNFDESETEEEDEDYIPKLSRVNTQEIEEYHKARLEKREEKSVTEDLDEEFPDEFLIYETQHQDENIPISRGKSFIYEDMLDQSGSGLT